MKPAVVFIGFMGAGKTSALAAAREAGLETTEIDELMAQALGIPIDEAFERHGEDAFRVREAEVAGDLLERADGGAIALGGGSVLSERVRRALGRHIVVWLQISAADAWRRIEGTARPLARGPDEVETLLAERLPLYERLADAIVMPAPPGVVARALPSIRALGDLPASTKLLWSASPSSEYPILVGPRLLESGWWPLEGRRFLVTDSSVGRLYADRLGTVAGRVEVSPGERAKTLAEAERVLRGLAAAGMTRADHIAALGGGVVGDLAGFCAHTYQRGVEVVHLPTTVVGQVDSAYGGKTGVDLPEGKNYVGAYQFPAAVIADTATLESLPVAERAAGLVEVLKTGLLAGGALWERVQGLDPRRADGLEELVFACARYKCEVVAADERDSGRRAVLNLGHTVGHAIETASGYRRYRHGEALGLGLLAALRLSGADELREQVDGMLRELGTPVVLDRDIDLDAVLAAVARDKKRTADGARFVLLAEPGEPQEGELVDPGRVRGAVQELAA